MDILKAQKKAQDFCDGFTERPEILIVGVGREPEFKVKVFPDSIWEELLFGYDAEYDLRQEIIEDGVSVFICRLTLDEYSIEHFPIIPFDK